MAVAIVILGTMSIFAIIIGIVATMPIVNVIGSDDPQINRGLWNGSSTQAITARDNATKAYLALGPVMIGAVIIFMFLAVSKRDYTDV